MGQSTVISTLVIGACCMAGCRPQAPMRNEIPNLISNQNISPAVTPAFTPSPWWRSNNEFSQLHGRLLSQNLDLKLGEQNLALRQLEYRISTGANQPKLNWSADASNGKVKTNPSATSMGMGLISQWELDLWGELKSKKKSAELNVQLSQEQQEALKLSLSYELLQAWATGALKREELALLNQQIKEQEQRLENTKDRFRQGLSPSIEVLQQKDLLLKFQGDLPQLNEQILQSERSIQKLLGQTTREANVTDVTTSVISSPMNWPFVPTTWVEDRYDGKMAWLNVLNADQRLLQAKAQRLPSLTLQASFNFSGEHPKAIFERWTRQLSASLLGPIFDGQLRELQQNMATVEVERQLLNYQNVALSAYHEIQTKWQRQLTAREQWQYAQQKTHNAEKLLAESKGRYPLGLVDFQTLLSHQSNLSLLLRQNQVAKANAFFADIDLMRSLGQPVF